jgi:uncharacterized protein YbjT (DUF2867 family)
MKIVVIGGSGLIGSKLVDKLGAAGHEAVAASPATGIDAVTGEGLDAALAGSDVVVDVANAPVWDDAAVLDFFTRGSGNLLAAEARAGTRHHVTLSVVGADRLPDSGYLRAKHAQEEVIRAGTIPYTILRATQFYEFLGRIAESAAGEDGTIHLSPALMQPVAAEDVASALADLAQGAPANGVVELAGPESLGMDVLGRRVLETGGDARPVVSDPDARYFGTALDDASLRPDGDAPRLGATRFSDWLATPAA